MHVDPLSVEGLKMPYDTGLSYDDVLCVPQRSPVDTRSNVDLSTELAPGIELELPILSAAMDTVTETEMARTLSAHGGLGVIHRFLPIDDQATMVREVRTSDNRAAAAVGIAEDYHDRADALVEAGVEMLVVDVAHGHMERTIDAVTDLAETFPETPLCAGNVATREGVADLDAAGADCVKIGVGPGSHCTTRKVTGFGVPQFTAVRRCADEARERGVTTIADGGIRTSGDAVKALLVGADAVMMGGYFAGADESPAPLVEVDGQLYKRSRGMSTAAAAEDRDDKDESVAADEGVEALSEYQGPVTSLVEEFAAGMRSGMSYAGATTLETARANAEFIRIESGVRERNSAHGVRPIESQGERSG